MSSCLPSLVASLPGIIIICGLIALFCIVLFDTTPARGKTRTVKFKEPEKIECGICNAIAKPNAPQEGVKFDTDDLLFKVEKEISPDSIVVCKRLKLSELHTDFSTTFVSEAYNIVGIKP
ncbi:unnamed protein product [Coccothraustes coccothraustes]